MDGAQIQKKLELSADEDFVLTAWEYRMMQRDIAASKTRHLLAKREVRNAFRTAAVSAFAARPGTEWSSPVVAERVRRVVPADGRPDLGELEDAGPEISAVVGKRSRALLLLIDLYGFEPWIEGKWDKSARADTLAEAHRALDQLHPEDLDAVDRAYRDARKKLSRSLTARSRRWTRYAILAGAGLGLGVLTGGLAAPAIAGAYGTLVLGYSGAVATSAGMAALGGGSIAAGGLGMAGGAALITGVGGAAGIGAATLGGRLAGFTAARVAADAIELHVVTQLVLRDVDGNEEAAKAVIVSLRERVTTLGRTVATLAARIDGLRAELASTQAELEAERALRLDTEARATRLRAATDRLKQRVTGPDNDAVKELLAELDELEGEKETFETLAKGVTGLADDLEKAAS
ncbi:hypothetical protein CGZ96_05285 [Enemella evansiae]|uniref:hypothetical protein n=2 Tax=Enemella evansiae TaxID=2016499 RepID=UPI000B972F15|nr:hypothetical protein [Enemella evansiae]OYN95575.1 hypothetical protein CGZ95_17900 [Enemella evansiae]OYO00330.1 hypothetical protein CGZ96_05285 [Enemella evansiae]